MVKTLFVWPQEPFLPTSLYKHYTYLGELAGYAQKLSDVKVLDLSVEKMDRTDLGELFSDTNYIFVPIEPYTVRNAIGLAELISQTSKARSIAYGTAPSMNANFFSRYFDIVLDTGHWEKALEKLLTNEEIFKNHLNKGVYSLNESLQPEEWPYPALNLLPIETYFKISGLNQLELSVQKGCKFNCSFCSEKHLIKEHNLYSRDPRNIALFLEKNLGREFYLDATTFSQNKQWALKVCESIKEIGYPIKWKTVTRIDRLDEEIVRSMAEAGCYKIGFGVETFSESLQSQIKKPIEFDNFLEISSLLKNNHITPRAFLILGIPGQTAQDIYSTQEKINASNIECRWKEYIPFEKIPAIKELKEFDEFERNHYWHHYIPGLSKPEYLKLLGVKR